MIQPRETTVDDVLKEVAQQYNLTLKALMGTNRSREITQARHVAAYLCKELTDSSLSEIGMRMGRRTHATILHSIAHVKQLLEFDPIMRQRVAQLQSALQH